MSDLENFEKFMLNYQNMVFTHAVRLLGNATDAADISQNVFLKAYEKFTDIAASPTVGGWLKTVTTNLCLNHLQRYRARWRFFSELENPDEEGTSFEAGLKNESASSAVDHDERELLEEALRRLPDAQRLPLVLHHFENLNCDEIAAKLGVGVGKVKTDMHRGRLALRRKLLRDESGELSALRAGS
jgi:RNA polymerase sigma-70 factor (ECF subfamily)